MIKGIIFDMDGVLVDAKEWHYEALNKALRLFGYEISRHAHLSVYDGLPTRKKLEMLNAEFGLPKELNGFINEMKQIFTLQIAAQECRPRFSHEYALSRLKNENFKIGVASNSIRATVEILMKYSHLTGYFDVMLSNEDVQRPKPDPDMYQKAMATLGLEPAECLVVEDNENGIQAAIRSGAHVMIVRDVADVTYWSISRRLEEIAREQKC